MKSPYKELACMFLPKEIRFLLIGESPPFTPPNEELRYFYNYKNTRGGQMLLSSVSYSFLGQEFYVDRDGKEHFLRRLQSKGVFLLDAVYDPINQIKDDELRRSKIEAHYQQLKNNIGKLPLFENAKMLLIHGNVIKAIGKRLRTDFQNDGYAFYDIGFASYYNDENFKKKIKNALNDG
jgi:hypothetical protein